ncbi:Pyridoxamine 5'-phosphate oxidase N-terminal domain-containing protein [Entamoeba marina]
MQETHDFLKSCDYYFLATNEGDQPRTRPLGMVDLYKGRLYFLINNVKPCYHQLVANPKCEISGVNKEYKTIRVYGKAVFDMEKETIDFMVRNSERIQKKYADPNGPKLAAFYIDDIHSYITSMDDSKQTLI